jgi:hypothetical protein
MKSTCIQTQYSSIVNLAIAPYKLESLIREGKLHPADFHCLDTQSKKSVWEIIRSLAVLRIG